MGGVHVRCCGSREGRAWSPEWQPAVHGNRPYWFRPDKIIRPIFLDSAVAFRDLRLLSDDVVLSSYPKTGTTWMHNILYCLLRMDESGKFMHNLEDDLASNTQIYPDAVPLVRPDKPKIRFGFGNFHSLCQQPSPRLFSTHMRDGLLPTSLKDAGRLVYMMRNAKDTLTSLHFFLKEVAARVPKEHPKLVAQEDWLGDGSTTGSYHRFNAWPEEQNTWWCGSYYGHVLGMDGLVRSLGQRATVVYYERLQEDLNRELHRLGQFLGVPISEAKIAAIAQRVSKKSMAARLEDSGKSLLLRKGVVGDYAQHLTPEHWTRMDRWFNERLGDASIAEPLKRWMSSPKEPCSAGA